MDSITKAKATPEQVHEMAKVAGLPPLTSVTELTGGEYNLAFMLEAGGKKYVLKIGPDPCTRVLSHEYGIMDVEVNTYKILAEQTDIPVPEIIHFGREVLGNQWFIMSCMPGKLFSESGLTGDERKKFYRQYGQKLAGMHRIHNATYGFTQLRQFSTWKDTYYDYLFTMLDDAALQGTQPPFFSEILRATRKHEYALDEVTQPCLVHYDLFDNNIFAGADGSFLGVIDTERSFWGDFYADFVAPDPMGHFFGSGAGAAPSIPGFGPFLSTDFIEGYNELAEEKIVDTPATRARIELMRVYLGLIMFTETATRLRYNDPAHWQRKHMGSMLIDMALKALNA